eukprot:GILI01007173.1.p2 GENE.GILI01007173.1~~GILI01007173.1.p2  ORF type:complete len:255 (-),score=88.04 GILI01007173.1:139-903(-)
MLPCLRTLAFRAPAKHLVRPVLVRQFSLNAPSSSRSSPAEWIKEEIAEMQDLLKPDTFVKSAKHIGQELSFEPIIILNNLKKAFSRLDAAVNVDVADKDLLKTLLEESKEQLQKSDWRWFADDESVLQCRLKSFPQYLRLLPVNERAVFLSELSTLANDVKVASKCFDLCSETDYVREQIIALGGLDGASSAILPASVEQAVEKVVADNEAFINSVPERLKSKAVNHLGYETMLLRNVLVSYDGPWKSRHWFFH